MRIAAFDFKPTRWPTLGAVLLIALTVYLGVWQTHRGDEKEERQRLLEARMAETPVVLTGSAAPGDALLYRHVRAAGEYDAAGQIYLDNQVMQGRAGYFVVTPLRLRDGAVVLVNRGWISRAAAYPSPPPAPARRAAAARSIACRKPSALNTLSITPLTKIVGVLVTPYISPSVISCLISAA